MRPVLHRAIRRYPDIKLLRRAEDIKPLQALQKKNPERRLAAVSSRWDHALRHLLHPETGK